MNEKAENLNLTFLINQKAQEPLEMARFTLKKQINSSRKKLRFHKHKTSRNVLITDRIAAT